VVAPAAALARDDVPWGAARRLEAGERGPPGEAGAPQADSRAPLAYLQYTSGSTGAPKGVLVTRRNLRANLEGIGEAARVTGRDRVFSWLPLFHDMGLVGALLFSLYWRLPLYLASPESFVLRPSSWLKALGALRITLAPAPHFAYALCATRLRERDLEGLDLRRWRLALDGAEPVRPDTVRAFIERFGPVGLRPGTYFPVYGLAEATLALTLPRPGEPVRVDRVQRRALLSRRRALPAGPHEADAAEHVALGRPLPGHHVSVHHPRTGTRLGERRVGEVWARGPSISPGYFGQAGPARGRRALRTGDLGYLADGQLFLVGRKGDVIIVGGSNVYPEDVERVAESVPGVRTGRVVAFGTPAGALATESVVVALEARAPQRDPGLGERVRRAVLERCGVPVGDVVLLPPRSLPLTPSGKRMRRRARELYLAHGWVALRHADDTPRGA
jgi:acyl-CoA synthetase (AMP-forming)/AMP-acid ligase II